jgi:hypothetical protein
MGTIVNRPWTDQVNLEMVDLTTNEKVWIGQKEIKKYVSRTLFGW